MTSTAARPPLQLDGLTGLVTRAIGETLWHLARAVPAAHAIVELGSYRGKSTAYLAHGAAAGHGATVHAVDPWDLQPPPGTNGRDYYHFARPSTRRDFDAQLTEVGVRGRVVAWRAYSAEAAAAWADHPTPIGLLYVDGDHTAAGVAADIAAWTPWLADGAVIVFDDYADDRNPGVAEAVDQALVDGPLAGCSARSPVADRLLIVDEYHRQ